MSGKQLVISLLFLALLPFLFSRCKKVYDPELDAREPVLVVDALVTNLAEPSYVKLSLALPFNSASGPQAVKGAKVSILESPGGTYYLKEIRNGHYITDTAVFKPEPGKIYTLHVVLADNEIYESSPQLLLPPAEVDSIHGIVAEKEYITRDINGQVVGRMEESVVTYLDFHSDAGPGTQFRFKNQLLIGYTFVDYSTLPFPSIIYLWKKVNQDKLLNITGLNNTILSDSVKNYLVSYYPLNSYLYGLLEGEYLNNWYIQVRQYSLNPDSYSFYREVEKQVSATGKIFDPIASQVSGNIQCKSHPGKLALGFFEVSSCKKLNYWVKPAAGDIRVLYGPTYDLDAIPDTGRSVQVAPFFWKY